MTLAAPGLDGMLCFDLYAASRAMTAVYRPLLAERNLTYPQYLVLTTLWEDDGVPIKDLATALRLDHGTLTPLLRRLESRGLLHRVRADDDARSVRVELTAAGEEMREMVGDVRCAVIAATGLDDDELAGLQRAVRRLTDSLSASVRAS